MLTIKRKLGYQPQPGEYRLVKGMESYYIDKSWLIDLTDGSKQTS